jgi:DNA-binding transcriptional MocR family regulator
MERIALSVLSDGHHRRHLERLRRRLSAAQVAATQALESRGVEFPYRPQGGMFLWGKLPSREAIGKLWYRALESGVLLAPGELFRPDGQASPFWRFNVAHCDSPRLYEFVGAVAQRNKPLIFGHK